MSKLHILELFTLALVSLHSVEVHCVAAPPLEASLKAFLSSPDRVEQIVYRRCVNGMPPMRNPVTSEMEDHNGKWAYSEGGWCNNSYYACALQDYADSAQNHVGPDRGGFSGFTGRMLWRISGEDLMLHELPENASAIEAFHSETDKASPVLFSLATGSITFFEVLSLGLPFVTPGSFSWEGDNWTATASSPGEPSTGHPVAGRLVCTPDHTPVAIIMTNSSLGIVFSNALYYDSKVDLPFGFPARIHCTQSPLVPPETDRQVLRSRPTVTIEVKVLKEADEASARRYTSEWFLKEPSRTGIYSNAMFYWITAGGPLAKPDRLAVFRRDARPDPLKVVTGDDGPPAGANAPRVLIFSVLVIGLLGFGLLFLMFRKATTKN